MIEYVTFEQFTEILAHNRDNAHDSDIWILHEDGSTEIVPHQPIAELQQSKTWPKFICRASAVNDHVTFDTARAADPNNPMAAVDGLYSALDQLNWAIGITVAFGQPVQTLKAHAAAITGRFLERRKRTPAQEEA